jgi:ParB family chromosome partitioning protein
MNTAAHARPLNGLMAIPLTLMRPSPNNPRQTFTEIDDLAASIREQGLIQPIIVQRDPGPEGYQIVAGERRYRALQRLGYSTAPCVVRRDMLPDEELLAALVENGQRAGLDPVEEAHALATLRDLESLGSNAAVARKIGRSVTYVARRLMLLELPAAEQEEIRAGAMPAASGERIIRERRIAQRPAQAGRIGRPKGARTRPHFGHTGTPKLGAVACGPCWETAIRADTPPASSQPTPPTGMVGPSTDQEPR